MIGSRFLPSPVAALLFAGLLSTLGCSSLKGRRVVDEQPGKRESAAGISYCLSKPRFDIAVKELESGKPAAATYELKTSAAADRNQRFEVGLKSGVFVSDSFQIQLEPDGRLSSVGVKSKDKTPALISSLGDFVKGLAAAVAPGLKSSADSIQTLKQMKPFAARTAELDRSTIVSPMREDLLKQFAADVAALQALPKLKEIRASKPNDPGALNSAREQRKEMERNLSVFLDALVTLYLDDRLELSGAVFKPALGGLVENSSDDYVDATDHLGDAASLPEARAILKTVLDPMSKLPEDLRDWGSSDLHAILQAACADFSAAVKSADGSNQGLPSLLSVLRNIAAILQPVELAMSKLPEADQHWGALDSLEKGIDQQITEACKSVIARLDQGGDISDDDRAKIARNYQIRRTLPPRKPTASDPGDKVAAYFARLKKAVDEALAEYLIHQKDAPFKAALDAYRKAVELALTADGQIQVRDPLLDARRAALLKFLRADIPSNEPKGRGETYAQFKQQLEEIDKVLTAVVSPAPKPPVTALATQLTRNLEDVLSLRVMHKADFDSYEALAKALIEYGSLDAVVLYMSLNAK